MTNEDHNRRGERDGGTREAESELQAAAQRLEEAVERLVHATTNHLSERVVNTVEGSVDRVRDVLNSSRGRNRRNRRRRSRRDRYVARSEYRTVVRRAPRRLFRDPSRKRIAGVCAGLADYFGTDPWVVRSIALCMLIFTPLSGVTFMAYWVAYFVMDPKPYDYDGEAALVEEREVMPKRSDRPRRRGREDSVVSRVKFRAVRSNFDEIETRLRSLESYVTSTQFELQRELSKISDAGDGETA